MLLSVWKVLLLVVSFGITGCGANGGFVAGFIQSSVDSPGSSGGGDDNPDNGNGGSGGGGAGDVSEELGICSDLSLDGVIWPDTLSLKEKRALALGLNISGSFEGGSGWANLTNNFDDQGMSFGLLNQNFGSGSLQPLWIKMRDRNLVKMKSIFGSSRFASLLGMLEDYEGSVSLAATDGIEGQLSPLDIPVAGVVKVNSAESDSVAWAVRTVYSDGGTTFDSNWKSELKKLGAAPEYVSIQIEAALKIHTKVLKYMTTLKLKELRSYLFLFDVCVQNGSLYQADLDDYASYFGSSSPTETARLNKILELRLRHVRSEYMTDVQKRKQAIINGAGTVHGSVRNLEKQYCYDDAVAITD